MMAIPGKKAARQPHRVEADGPGQVRLPGKAPWLRFRYPPDTASKSAMGLTAAVPMTAAR
jgi:hypothetical protein